MDETGGGVTFSGGEPLMQHSFLIEALEACKAAGMHTVICGPGSIEQAHRADEYIELAQLARCDRFLSALIHSQAA